MYRDRFERVNHFEAKKRKMFSMLMIFASIYDHADAKSRTGVSIIGTTVGPGFVRPESKR